MKLSVSFLLSLCFLLPPYVMGQSSAEIRKKEQELERLRTEIRLYEKKLQESTRKEKLTLENLDVLERQIELIRRLVADLRKQEEALTKEIIAAQNSINELERQLSLRKQNYANYIKSIYKHGRMYDLEIILSSRSFNQLAIRLEYLRRFSQQRQREMRRIEEKRNDLEQQHRLFEENLDLQRRLLTEKTGEEHLLKQKADNRQKTLRTIRSNRKMYQEELSRRTEAMRRIEKLISELIEKERIRKERLAAEAKRRAEREKIKPPEPTSKKEMLGTFALKKGKLRWPVSSGTIASRFGTQVHPVLKTVTENTGIEISSPAGSKVFAVANGEVAVISFIPGFGNVIILNHEDGFRTVYAHLSDIIVNETQQVNEGEIIAKSGDSVSGTALHFEIWKDREKQNPELWLSKHH